MRKFIPIIFLILCSCSDEPASKIGPEFQGEEGIKFVEQMTGTSLPEGSRVYGIGLGELGFYHGYVEVPKGSVFPVIKNANVENGKPPTKITESLMLSVDLERSDWIHYWMEHNGSAFNLYVSESHGIMLLQWIGRGMFD